MKYLKSFNESAEVSLKDKIQAIVDMYIYLTDKEIGSSFVGDCTGLFMGISEIVKSSKRVSQRLFNPDVELIFQSLDGSRYSDRKIEDIEKLYPFAKEIYGNKTIDKIQELIEPVIKDSNVIDGIIYEKDWFWRSFDMKQAFIFNLRVDPEIYDIDEHEVMGKGHAGRSHWDDKDKIPQMEGSLKIFWRYRQIFNRELRKIPFKNNGLRYEILDSAHFNDLYKLRLLILPIKSN